jgi:hypothetical protein
VPNPNPWQARLKRWEKQWPKPIATVQAQAWAVLQLAYEGVGTDDAETRRKNIHVYFTALSVFAKLLETNEIAALSERIIALEARLQEQGSTNGHHTPYAR